MIVLIVAAAWLTGATLGALGYTTWWPAIALGSVGAGLYLVVAGRRGSAVICVLAVLACLASLARYDAALPEAGPTGIAVYNEGEPVRLLGTIASEPEDGATTQRFTVEVAAVERDGAWQEINGRVLVTRRLYPRDGYGDIVEITASLETPPVFETFDYREYLARRGVGSTALFPAVTVLPGKGGDVVKRAFIEARRPFTEALEQTLPEPEAALAKGILLGQRSSIPDDVNEAFNAAGISHLIAISGYNVMLVSGAAIGALAPLIGRRRALWVAMALVVAYACFVGLSPSVLRATLMALVMLGAMLAGRPGNALTGVALAGALMVLHHPRVIEDVSFQLSFAATLGIVTLATPLREWLLAVLWARVTNGLASAIADHVAITTAASLAVVPFIAASFGRISLVAIPVNVLAAPVFAFALLGSLLTSVAGVIDTGLGRFAGEVGYIPLHYLVVLAKIASGLPGASTSISGFGPVQTMVFIVVLLAFAAALARAKVDVVAPASLPRFGPAPAFALASVVAAGVVWWGALQPDGGHLRVSVLDVGQGDAILVEGPTGARMLVDGGPGGAVTQALGDVLPSFDRRIDLMVLTHAQDDHVTGLVEVLERFDVGAVLWNGVPGATAAFEAWTQTIEQKALPVSIATAGQVIDLGEGAYLEVLHPQPGLLTGTEDDQNNNAIVMRLVYGEVSFLLTGDIEVDAENAILDAGYDVSATVLKVSHHGSDGATTQAFLDAVAPAVAVVSAGEGNPFGHPSPTLRLRLADVPLFRTDTHGTVRFETDGETIWVRH